MSAVDDALSRQINGAVGCLPLASIPLPYPQVIFAGTPDQCRQVVETAEPFREALSERGVLFVVLPAYGSGTADAADVPPLKDTDLRCAASQEHSISCSADIQHVYTRALLRTWHSTVPSPMTPHHNQNSRI